MWPKSAITSQLNIDYPIIQAPMILQKPLIALASAVSNAGGLGSLGCAEMSLSQLEQAIDEMRLATNKPFNLNFFMHQSPVFDVELDVQVKKLVEPFYKKLGLDFPTDTASSDLRLFDDETVELLIRKRVAMVSFHFGCPDMKIVDSLKSAGIVTATTATTVDEAQKIEKAGLDFIVAQGWEAGGHRGSFDTGYEDTGTGTLALVPQIVDAVNIPVIAAGGIGDGRGIVATHALGASGVWLGTAFLTCTEAPVTAIHRHTILNARDQDTHLSRAFSGRPCRARKTPYSTTMATSRPLLPDFPLMYNYSGPLKKYGIVNDDLDYQFLLYGQAAALNCEQNAAQLISKLNCETINIIQKLNNS